MNDETQQQAPRRGWIVLIPLLAFAALAAVFFKGLSDGDTSRKLPSVLIGKPVPKVDVPPLDGFLDKGKPVPGVKFANLAKGKVSVVNVWASWCVPCRQEHPQLLALSKMGDFNIVGINYRDKPEDAARFLRQLGSPYTQIGSDRRGRVGIAWGVVGVPETYIVDGKGIIRYKFIGPISAEALKEDLLPKIREVQTTPYKP